MATISIPVQFEKDPQAPFELSVIIADSQGNILQQSALDSNRKANVDDALLKRSPLQIAVLPNMDEQLQGIKNLDQLSRFKPFITTLGWNGQLPVLKPVPPIFSDWWNVSICRVIGRVTKNYLVNNVNTRLPLCRAKVHICEVDKISWILPKIPDHIILRIPELIERIPPRPPVVINPIPPVIIRPNIPVNPGIFTRKAVPSIRLEPAIAAKFNTLNPQILRAEIANNFHVLKPFFCKIPWLWPYFYRCDEIKTVFTDENGRFDTAIKYCLLGDKPDIYIWVECFINGAWTTVYRPSIACNTWWDYPCGTEILVNVTDERVKPSCAGTPVAGEAVWVRSIGNYSVRDVLQISNNSPIQNIPFERKGLFRYGSDYRSPFATTSQSARMDFSVIFGSGLPSAGVKYFRWACRKIANEELVPEISPVFYLKDPVSRSFLVEHHIGPLTLFNVDSVQLGPVTVGATEGLFHIPPPNPVGFLGVTSSVGWMSMSVDTTNLDTRTLHGDGLYEFWLEVFDTAGNRVNPPATFFQIPQAANFNASETATGSYAGLESGSNIFKMVVRIDSLNNHTVAEIYPVKLTGSGGSFTVSNPCGFLDFADNNASNISIPFKAFQAKNFADFSFSVGRGNAGTGAFPTVASVSGMVIGDAGRYVRDADGVYQPDDSPDLEFSPAELMQSCISGGRAAFTENLYVAALHTDGYRRLQELDSSSSAAFALSRTT